MPLASEAWDQLGSTITVGGDGCRYRLRIEGADSENAAVPRAIVRQLYQDALGRRDRPDAPPIVTSFQTLYRANANCVLANVDVWFAQGQFGYAVFPAKVAASRVIRK